MIIMNLMRQNKLNITISQKKEIEHFKHKKYYPK